MVSLNDMRNPLCKSWLTQKLLTNSYITRGYPLRFRQNSFLFTYSRWQHTSQTLLLPWRGWIWLHQCKLYWCEPWFTYIAITHSVIILVLPWIMNLSCLILKRGIHSLISRLQVTESWAGPGNETRGFIYFQELWYSLQNLLTSNTD